MTQFSWFLSGRSLVTLILIHLSGPKVGDTLISGLLVTSKNVGGVRVPRVQTSVGQVWLPWLEAGFKRELVSDALWIYLLYGGWVSGRFVLPGKRWGAGDSQGRGPIGSSVPTFEDWCLSPPQAFRGTAPGLANSSRPRYSLSRSQRVRSRGGRLGRQCPSRKPSTP